MAGHLSMEHAQIDDARLELQPLPRVIPFAEWLARTEPGEGGAGQSGSGCIPGGRESSGGGDLSGRTWFPHRRR